MKSSRPTSTSREGWLSSVRALFIGSAALAIYACSGGEMEDPAAADGSAAMESPAAIVTTDSGLMIKMLQTGAGAVAEPGQTVSVHYTGWLYVPENADGRGAKFDSSVDRGSPFQFPLGAGRVIAGWDEGVAGMLIGEKRELIIPPDLGYGSRGAGGVIPPDATLLFEVELLGLE